MNSRTIVILGAIWFAVVTVVQCRPRPQGEEQESSFEMKTESDSQSNEEQRLSGLDENVDKLLQNIFHVHVVNDRENAADELHCSSSIATNQPTDVTVTDTDITKEEEKYQVDDDDDILEQLHRLANKSPVDLNTMTLVSDVDHIENDAVEKEPENMIESESNQSNVSDVEEESIPEKHEIAEEGQSEKTIYGEVKYGDEVAIAETEPENRIEPESNVSDVQDEQMTKKHEIVNDGEFEKAIPEAKPDDGVDAKELQNVDQLDSGDEMIDADYVYDPANDGEDNENPSAIQEEMLAYGWPLEIVSLFG